MVDIIPFGVTHKKVSRDFPGETFRILKEKEGWEYTKQMGSNLYGLLPK
jgi:hypothetical protein